MVGLATGTQAQGESIGHKATRLLWFLLLLICLFLLLFHDLCIPLLAGAAKSLWSRSFPLTESLCFFMLFGG